MSEDAVLGLQIVTLIIAVVGGIIGIGRMVHEWRETRRQAADSKQWGWDEGCD